MTKKVSRREAAANFDALVGALERTREPVIVEDGGRVVAVLVNPADYDAAERDAFLAMLKRIHRENADQDSAEIERDIARAVEEVRTEHYEREHAKA